MAGLSFIGAELSGEPLCQIQPVEVLRHLFKMLERLYFSADLGMPQCSPREAGGGGYEEGGAWAAPTTLDKWKKMESTAFSEVHLQAERGHRDG